MRTYIKRLPGFSLIELVIVMMLSGVVLGMVYYSFHITQLTFTRFLKNKKQQEDFHVMNANLERDFFKSDSITYQDRIVSCYLKDEMVIYDIAEKGIYRNQNNSLDTLQIVVEECICSFEREETQSGWIDELLINYLDKRGHGDLHFIKNYDAVSILSYNKRNTK